MTHISLFVYGTLKRGERNHHFLAGQNFLSAAWTLPFYRLIDCGFYPGLREDRANGIAIAGELWHVEERALSALDAFEGVPDLFDRRALEMADVAGPVFAYFYVGDAGGKIAAKQGVYSAAPRHSSR